jgi:hypothetical protein
MKALGWLLAAAVALAVLRAALAVLITGLVVLLIVTLWINPQAVLGFIALCMIGGLVRSYPLACLGLAALMVWANILHQMAEPVADCSGAGADGKDRSSGI